ncbi:MAG: hypothetical protein ACQEQG_04995 [Bacillota bacterium]
MKKVMILSLTLMLIFVFSVSTQALMRPEVNQGQGHFLINLVVPQVDSGFSAGGNYGLTDSVGIAGEIGDPFSRLGFTYELNPNFGVSAGYIVDKSVYLSLSASTQLTQKMTAVGEFGLASPTDSLALLYDAGIIYDLPENIDVRASINGLTSNNTKFKLGFGYSF